MSIALRIARRYLFSRKSTNVINILTGISMVGMGVGTMALILVLSVFNGLEGLVFSLYDTFDPDIRITPIEGKTFVPNDDSLLILTQIEGIAEYSAVVQDNAILRYGENEYIATIKGVEGNYGSVTGIPQGMIRGDFLLGEGDQAYMVMGAGIELALGLNLDQAYKPVTLYVPRKGKISGMSTFNAFNRKTIIPSGVFSIQQEFDTKYAFVPVEFARDLMQYRNGEISALELKLNDDADMNAVQDQLIAYYGERFEVKNRYQQNETLYKVMRNEKWAVYAILTLILLVAAFNIIGSLSMLVIEKEHNISILKTMGATDQIIRRIFLLVGMLTSLIGAGVGAILAVLVCFAQQYFKIIKLNSSGGTFIVREYPVELQLGDFLLVITTVVAISLLASWWPAKRAAKQALLVNTH